MLFLSFLFACEWLIDYTRIWGAPSATSLIEFNRWVTSYKGPGNNPDARYLLYSMQLQFNALPEREWAISRLFILTSESQANLCNQTTVRGCTGGSLGSAARRKNRSGETIASQRLIKELSGNVIIFRALITGRCSD